MLAVLLLLVWGALKVPWEIWMTREQRLATVGFSGPTTVALREKLGEGLALAALGGFRVAAPGRAFLGSGFLAFGVERSSGGGALQRGAE